jgi:hypothetical protein
MLMSFAMIGVVLTMAAAPVAATTSMQENSTSTETQASTCEPRETGPELQQARVYSGDPVIEQGSPGDVSATLVSDIQNNCDLVVQLTLTIPSGMTISGSSDVSSGGGGVVTNTLTLQPGESQSLSANVYSSILGEQPVTSQITYYPSGHPDMAREIDGQTLNFDVQEEYMPEGSNQTSANNTSNNEESTPVSTPDGPLSGITTLQWLLGIVSVTVVGLLGLVGLGMTKIADAVPDKLDIRNVFKKE